MAAEWSTPGALARWIVVCEHCAQTGPQVGSTELSGEMDVDI